jgi:hypothetical protein
LARRSFPPGLSYATSTRYSPRSREDLKPRRHALAFAVSLAACAEDPAGKAGPDGAADLVADAPAANLPEAAPGLHQLELAPVAEVDVGPPPPTCKVHADCPKPGEACVVARCQPTGTYAVVFADDGAPCDDGDACTLGDPCQANACKPGKDTCGCTTDLDCLTFDDGDKCNGVPFCDLGSQPSKCLPNPKSVVTCQTATEPCQQAVCTPATGLCSVTPTDDGNACDDGLFCTQGDHCEAGACKAGKDVCPCAKNADCPDDGDLCNGVPYCDKSAVPYACKVNPTSVVQCDRSGDNACGKNTCDKSSGACAVVGLPAGTTCSDGDACTVGDVCKAGQCVPGESACGCKNDADCAKVEDGNFCNGTLFGDKSAVPYQCKVNPATIVVCSPAGDTACLKNLCAPQAG